jgi:uncharacterized membrane protein
MGKDRLTAFSDGVIAIIITIMVLELKVPHGADWTVLLGVTPNFVSYVLSFIYLAIYWNNHHHLLHTVTKVDGLILWTNSYLLFWLSLIPAATAWMGENFLAPIPLSPASTAAREHPCRPGRSDGRRPIAISIVGAGSTHDGALSADGNTVSLPGRL